MATEKQIAANRANASRSKGPRTPAGKRRASRNAIRHGFSGGIPLSTGASQIISKITSLFNEGDVGVHESQAIAMFAIAPMRSCSESAKSARVLQLTWKNWMMPSFGDWRHWIDTRGEHWPSDGERQTSLRAGVEVFCKTNPIFPFEIKPCRNLLPLFAERDVNAFTLRNGGVRLVVPAG
jgi:hypothetical protein